MLRVKFLTVALVCAAASAAFGAPEGRGHVGGLAAPAGPEGVRLQEDVLQRESGKEEGKGPRMQAQVADAQRMMAPEGPQGTLKEKGGQSMGAEEALHRIADRLIQGGVR